jgi:AhpD family alkylhydroperoxidase
MPRVPLIPAQPADPRVAEAFSVFEREGRVPIDLHRALANAPAVLDGFVALGQALRHEAGTPRTLRELLILRIAQLTGSEYEWCHHVRMARAAGVPAEQVTSLAGWAASDVHDARQRAVLQLADEVHRIGVSEATFDALTRHFTIPQIVELVVCAAHYEAAARILQALHIEVEPGYQPSSPGMGS